MMLIGSDPTIESVPCWKGDSLLFHRRGVEWTPYRSSLVNNIAWFTQSHALLISMNVAIATFCHRNNLKYR